MFPARLYSIRKVNASRSKRRPRANNISSYPWEEKADAKFIARQDSLGRPPVRIKYIPTLAFTIARRRSPASRPNKPPGKNWAQAFGKRHPEIQAKRIRSINWKCHEIYMYDKVT
ncbi:hypothetical protein T440DRAFT_410947, partial [Plenodomus tracheiphilus IPT5]